MSQPLHSISLERELIASVWADPERFGLLDGSIRPEDFHSPAHAILWQAFADITKRKMPLEPQVVREHLVRAGNLERVGGDAALLCDTLGTMHPEQIAAELTALSMRRRVTTVALELAGDGQNPQIETATYLEGAEKKLVDALVHADLGGGPEPISKGAFAYFEDVVATSKLPKGSISGLRFGIQELDRHLAGVQPGELIVLAGRPGMGKTAFARLACLFGASQGEHSVFFSMEMPRKTLAGCFVASEADVCTRRMRAATLSGPEWERVARATQRVSEMPIHIDDTGGMSLAQLRNRARRMHIRHGKLACIVVDYLQLMSGSNGRDNREQQISEISRGLKALAKELGCPVIALSQLNRKVEERPNKRPCMADLRESGAIEQDADTILLLYRRGYYAAKAATETKGPTHKAHRDDIQPGVDDGIAEVIIEKQRMGDTGVVRCRFVAPSARFQDLERSHG
jgi:replicative DNA helicase